MQVESAPAKQGVIPLTASACGTALASVCALGINQVEKVLGGIYSAAAVITAGILCLFLSSALARLCLAIPSGAGLLAYVSRGLGRRAGLLLVFPYFLLSLVLLAVEATIIGVLVSQLLPIPQLLGSYLFLGCTWFLCRSGVQLGYRTEVVTTALLVLGLLGLSIYSLGTLGSGANLPSRLFPAPPSLARFVTGVGQSLFLFMGFELITSHVEIAKSPKVVGHALRWSVLVLILVNGVVALGVAGLAGPLLPNTSHELLQIAFAAQTGSRMTLVVLVLLTLLLSFTSVNGSFLAFSRLGAALASQGVLPRDLTKVHMPTLVPRRMLDLLVALAALLVGILLWRDLLSGAILAAAAAAALVYACISWITATSSITEKGRTNTGRFMGKALALLLLGLSVAVVVGTRDTERLATLLLLALAYGISAILMYRMGSSAKQHAKQQPHPRLPTLGRSSLLGGASHVD